MGNTKKPVQWALSRRKSRITGLLASKNRVHGGHRHLRNLLTVNHKTCPGLCERTSRAKHFLCFPTLQRLVGRVSAPHGKLRKVHLTLVKSDAKPRLSKERLGWLAKSANEHRVVAQRLHSFR